jgi:hypothetical protein
VQGEVESAKAESKELSEAYDQALARKWKTSTISKHHSLAIKRVTQAEARVGYYTKIMEALRAGYYIVPPMDMELFAIRTDQKNPRKFWRYLISSHQGNFQQSCKVLPIGKGDYKNPHPKVENDYRKETKNAEGLVVRPYWADRWDDIEFPINMIKPQIMEATGKAMAAKIFDELGVLPQDYRRNPDPVILGRIYEPKQYAYQETKVLTFLIAWHLNTKDL